ncbi:MAG: sporulation protein YunB [Syntrophomonadaceae bacterium]|jgi:sporulation protein YunB
MLGRRSARPLLVLIVIVLVAAACVLADFRLKASTIQIARAQAQVTGSRLINEVVNEKIAGQVKYEDLVLIHKDSTGRVVLIQPNTIMLNKIMTSTVLEVSNSMGEMEDSIISVPMGQLSGSNILAGYGPRLKVRIIPTGQVHVEVKDKFEQAGINQTRHLIFFNIKAIINVAVPFIKESVEVSTVIPLAETIVVGDVPQTYVNLTGGGELVYPYIRD